MEITKYKPVAQIVATLMIFSAFLIMGMQFTVHHFTSKESLVFPIIILAVMLVYHLLFDREIAFKRNSLPVLASLLLFAVYYILNLDGSSPLKLEYISYFSLIVVLFAALLIFKNRVVDTRMWILFVFVYANIFYVPVLLSVNKLIAANSNGIIAFLLLFFCFINLKEKQIVFRVITVYTTILLIITLFTATSRAAMMAFIIAVFVFFAIKYLHRYLLYIVGGILFLSPFVTALYIYLNRISLGEKLNSFTLEVTGKPFFSGRDTIWNEAMDTVFLNGKFWTGLGNNFEYHLLGGYLHNLYVQVFYQSGMIGFMLLALVLIALTVAISRTKVIDFEFRVLFGYFVAILFLQVFEGHMIYKFEIISVLMWIILAFLIRKTSHKPAADSVTAG